MELDTAAGGNIMSVPMWKKIGKPELSECDVTYRSASDHPIPILGSCVTTVSYQEIGRASCRERV